MGGERDPRIVVDATVWYEPVGMGRPRQEPIATVITKVARRWAYTDDQRRFDTATFEVDGQGYSSPGRIWLDRAEYEEDRAKVAAWHRLNESICYGRPPKHLTAAQIEEIVTIIRKAD